MVIGVCTLEFHLPACRSLKQKRMILNRLRGRLTGRFNVAFAEVEHQDLWQRAGVAVASVSSSHAVLESMFHKIVNDAERHVDGVLLRYDTEFF